MKNKANNSGVVATAVIAILLIAILSVLTFAVPFTKVDQNVLLIVYLCSVALFALEGGLTIGLLFGKGNGNQKVLGLPIVYSGLIGTIIQLAVTIAFYVANAFVSVPLWIPIVVEAVLYCFVAIQLALGFFFRARNEEYHENKANTGWMDSLRAEIKILASSRKEGELGKAYEDLYDLARGSDPVGNDKSFEVEKKIDGLLTELKTAREEGASEKEIGLVGDMTATLKERNALCKLGK